MSTVEEINWMNQILLSATNYGGDQCGPWFCNGECLLEDLTEWLHNHNFDGYKAKYMGEPGASYIQIVDEAAEFLGF